ncbi:hypothetical protein KV205_31520 [Streptomyces sp. SKN60]|uniref:hypothetical protein n=1 Tax=Streptomyces sp. SKN60 TaxID=2855506 RepID=UPI0022466BC9|nr:hypothetical protein [Streptomyces sp. SKN60]MCX2185016.1 hypothetical protein [Streptomyces sp. SKN60]
MQDFVSLAYQRNSIFGRCIVSDSSNFVKSECGGIEEFLSVPRCKIERSGADYAPVRKFISARLAAKLIRRSFRFDYGTPQDGGQLGFGDQSARIAR